MTKSKLTLILVSVLTVVVAAFAVFTAVLLQQRNVGPTESKAGSYACSYHGSWGSIPGCASTPYQICGHTNAADCGCSTADCNSRITCDNVGICDTCQSGWHKSGSSCVQDTPAPTQPVGGCSDPNYAGKVNYFGTQGGGIRILNCSGSTYAAACSTVSFHCDSNTGDAGHPGQCSSNQQSGSPVNVSIPNGQEGMAALTACSPGSCGSCQSDIQCGSATDGKFVAAATSCGGTGGGGNPSPTPAPTTRVPASTPTTAPVTYSIAVTAKCTDDATANLNDGSTFSFRLYDAGQSTNRLDKRTPYTLSQLTSGVSFVLVPNNLTITMPNGQTATLQKTANVNGVSTNLTTVSPITYNTGYHLNVNPTANGTVEFLFAGCKTGQGGGGSTPTPTPTPSPTPEPTRNPQDTATPTPTPTNSPTPGPTQAPGDTATPVPTPTNTPVPTKTLPNTGIVDDLILPVIIGSVFIGLAIFLAKNKKRLS